MWCDALHPDVMSRIHVSACVPDLLMDSLDEGVHFYARCVFSMKDEYVCMTDVMCLCVSCYVSTCVCFVCTCVMLCVYMCRDAMHQDVLDSLDESVAAQQMDSKDVLRELLDIKQEAAVLPSASAFMTHTRPICMGHHTTHTRPI